MALYDYKCESCQTVTERRMPMRDVVSEIDCPSCGKPAKKALSMFAVVGIGDGGGDFDFGDEGGMGGMPGMGGMGGDHGHDHGGFGGMDDMEGLDF